MAKHTCSIKIALAISQRLASANVPFTLDALNPRACVVHTSNSATLDRVVASVPRVTGSMEYPQPQQIPKDVQRTLGRAWRPSSPSDPISVTDQQKFFTDFPSGTHCTPTGRIAFEFEPELHRIPASIGTDASCPMTDTEFDNDPSVVLE